MHLAAQIAAHRPGHAPDRVFYTDAAIFEQDLTRLIYRHWVCTSQIAHAGDCRVSELGSESIVLVCNQHSEIHAL